MVPDRPGGDRHPEAPRGTDRYRPDATAGLPHQPAHVFCGGGAAALLTWHGGLFVVHGVLIEAGAVSVEPDLAALTGWYLYLWRPWFIMSGLAFEVSPPPSVPPQGDRRKMRLYGAVGALGALVLSLVSTATGIG